MPAVGGFVGTIDFGPFSASGSHNLSTGTEADLSPKAVSPQEASRGGTGTIDMAIEALGSGLGDLACGRMTCNPGRRPVDARSPRLDPSSPFLGLTRDTVFSRIDLVFGGDAAGTPRVDFYALDHPGALAPPARRLAAGRRAGRPRLAATGPPRRPRPPNAHGRRSTVAYKHSCADELFAAA
jgi:hypothetical protein